MKSPIHLPAGRIDSVLNAILVVAFFGVVAVGAFAPDLWSIVA